MKIEAHIGEDITAVAQRAVDAVAAGEPFVSFDFNGIKLDVIAGQSAGDVVAEYHRRMDEQSAAYRASPEYKEQQRVAEKKAKEEAAALADALSRAPAKMTLRDFDGWADFVGANDDPYGAAVISYAERWARLMEGEINSGVSLEMRADQTLPEKEQEAVRQRDKIVAACAKRMSYLANVEGITGFMYGCAVSVLAKVWVHGEALRRWHNLDTQIGDEGVSANESGGVLNPALLNIG